MVLQSQTVTNSVVTMQPVHYRIYIQANMYL